MNANLRDFIVYPPRFHRDPPGTVLHRVGSGSTHRSVSARCIREAKLLTPRPTSPPQERKSTPPRFRSRFHRDPPGTVLHRVGSGSTHRSVSARCIREAKLLTPRPTSPLPRRRRPAPT